MNIITIHLTKETSGERVVFQIQTLSESNVEKLGTLSLQDNLFNSIEEWKTQYRNLCLLLKQREKYRGVIEFGVTPENNNVSDDKESIRNKLKEITLKIEGGNDRIEEEKNQNEGEFEKWITSISKENYVLFCDHFKAGHDNLVFIRTDCDRIRSLPWQLLEKIIKKIRKDSNYIIQTVLMNKGTNSIVELGDNDPLKILTLKGNSKYLNTGKDIEILDEFCKSYDNIEFDYSKDRDTQGISFQDLIKTIQNPNANYNIIYYCGHSGNGNITLRDGIPVDPKHISYSLNELVRKGLKLLIFNSCDGLKLADNNYIPCTVVMREEIPDEVSHYFIQKFIDRYEELQCIYLSMHHARNSTAEAYVNHQYYSCVDWLPIMVQSTSSLISLPALTRSNDNPSSEDKFFNELFGSDNRSPSRDEVFSKILIPSLIAIVLISTLGGSYLNFFKQDTYRKPTIITESPIQSDNIIGCYKWLNNLTIEVFTDGTALQFINDERGKWKINESGKYKYTFTWGLGWQQDVNFLPDGTVEGLNTEPGNDKSYEFIGFKIKQCKTDRSSNYKKKLYKASVVAVASLLTTATVYGARSIGWLESLELKTYDRMLANRPAKNFSDREDPLIKVVEISKKDINADPQKVNILDIEGNVIYQTISDDLLVKTIKKIRSYNPAVIGLDIFRDNASPSLSKEIYDDRGIKVINIFQLPSGDCTQNYIAPPQSLSNTTEQLGFANIYKDRDYILRHHPLSSSFSPAKVKEVKKQCEIPGKVNIPNPAPSFSLELAIEYLKKQDKQRGINRYGDISVNNESRIDHLIPSLPNLAEQPNAYAHTLRNNKEKPYEILINYHQQTDGTKLASLSDDPSMREQFENKIVIIGIKDSSRKPEYRDRHDTPYGEMWGVEIQRQLTEQILYSLMGNSTVIHTWNWQQEGLWILGWGIIPGIGTILCMSKIDFDRNRAKYLSIAGGCILISPILIGGTCYLLLSSGVWVPAIPPILVSVLTAGSMVGIDRYHRRKSIASS
jgi:CHASE2 domain-containing sensor protein